jgi:hypothetical protein
MSGLVQVNDARPVGTDLMARPEAAKGEGSGSARRPVFRAKLVGKRAGDAPASDQMSTVGPGATFRPELAQASATPPASAPSGPALRNVLLGGTATSAEARVHFGAGRLAGSEIRLAASEGAVTAQLLTPSNESRQTLMAVMDEVRWRLWRKGVARSGAEASASARTPPDRNPERSNR